MACVMYVKKIGNGHEEGVNMCGWDERAIIMEGKNLHIKDTTESMRHLLK